MVETTLAKKEEASLVSQELIDQVRMLTGESNRGFPFVPILQINNRSEKKMALVEGKEVEVKVPPEQGFIITEKINNEYKSAMFSPALQAVILKERYEISNKYKEGMPIEQQFYSREFDSWTKPIDIFRRSDNEIIFTGTYKEIKEKYKSETLDRMGNPQKLFNLTLVLYIHHLDVDKIYRFKSKMNTYNKWFDYKNSFGQNDTFVAYETNFPLHKETKGDIEFWYSDFERGKSVDLANELTYLKQINQYFQLMDAVKSGEVVYDRSETQVKTEKYPGDQELEDIPLDSIPF